MPIFDFIASLFEFFTTLCSADKSLKENSLVGESEFDRETRRSWRRWSAGCLILLILAAISALLAWLWW